MCLLMQNKQDLIINKKKENQVQDNITILHKIYGIKEHIIYYLLKFDIILKIILSINIIIQLNCL